MYQDKGIKNTKKLKEWTEISNHFQGGKLYLGKNYFDFIFLRQYKIPNLNP